MKIPNTPFATRLSGRAKETELRLRSIFQWKKKRPSIILIVLVAAVLLAVCGSLVCIRSVPDELIPEIEQWIEAYPWSEKSDLANEDTRWVIERIKRTNRRYELMGVPDEIYEIKCRSESGATELTLTLLVNPNTLAISPEPESWYIGGKKEPSINVSETDPLPTSDELDVEQLPQPAPDEPDAEDLQPPPEEPEFVRELSGAVSYRITAGNTGRQIELTGQADVEKLIGLINGLSVQTKDDQMDAENIPLGYLYAIRAVDRNGTASDGVRVTKDRVQSGAKYGYYVEGTEALIAYLDGLYESYSTDTQDVLDFVDTMFAEGDVDLWAFLLPGTGPISTSLEDRYEQVRAVFARYEWTLETGKEPKREWSHDDWTMYLPNKTCRIAENTNSNWVNFARITAEGSTNANYSYNGEPGSLSRALLELEDGPSFRLARVYIPIEGQDNQNLIETYETRFRELYLNSGAISDYKLLALSPIEVETDPATTTPFFLFSFSVKPSDPDSPSWKRYTVKNDGWVDFSFEVSLSTGGYENDSVWMCGFWQWPRDDF